MWAFHGQPPGDRYDEQAAFFLKGLPALIGFLVLFFSEAE